jgi:hypothetical protein
MSRGGGVETNEEEKISLEEKILFHHENEFRCGNSTRRTFITHVFIFTKETSADSVSSTVGHTSTIETDEIMQILLLCRTKVCHHTDWDIDNSPSGRHNKFSTSIEEEEEECFGVIRS